jgi:Phage tail tube protein
MPTGTGLDGQLMFGAESVAWGTAVTPDHAVEFDSETLVYNPGFIEPTGLRVGTMYKRASRVRVARQTVSGDVMLEIPTKGIGLLLKQAIGSALAVPVQIGTTTAYKQIHTPAGLYGLGATLQIGRPEPGTGTVRPFTYAGCKFSAWEFDVKDNATPTLKLTVDGKSATGATALATPSFLTGSTVFDFSQAAIKLGGTATTASGETTIAGGTAMSTIVTDFTLTGANPLDTTRYGLGNAGQKAQQLQNANPTITGKLAAEFGKVELYDVFAANTTFCMEMDLISTTQIGTSGNFWTLSLIMPAVKLKTAPPNVSGPGVVQMSSTFEVYSDELNPVVQVKVVSDETVL